MGICLSLGSTSFTLWACPFIHPTSGLNCHRPRGVEVMEGCYAASTPPSHAAAAPAGYNIMLLVHPRQPLLPVPADLQPNELPCLPQIPGIEAAAELPLRHTHLLPAGCHHEHLFNDSYTAMHNDQLQLL